MSDIPRRIRIDLMTPAELAIRAAVIAVEEAGCDERLTDAVVLLQEAKERVADFVDKWPRREKLYTESEHREAIAQAYERCAVEVRSQMPGIGGNFVSQRFDKWAAEARKGENGK